MFDYRFPNRFVVVVSMRARIQRSCQPSLPQGARASPRRRALPDREVSRYGLRWGCICPGPRAT
eukprot:8778980-Lingulodinium_polyedra.AAC.1